MGSPGPTLATPWERVAPGWMEGQPRAVSLGHSALQLCGVTLQ